MQYMDCSGGGVSKLGSAVKMTYQSPSRLCISGAQRSVLYVVDLGGKKSSFCSALFQSLQTVNVVMLQLTWEKDIREDLASEESDIGVQ